MESPVTDAGMGLRRRGNDVTGAEVAIPARAFGARDSAEESIGASTA